MTMTSIPANSALPMELSEGNKLDELTDKEFENAPGWAKLINLRLNKVLGETQLKLDACVKQSNDAFNIASDMEGD